MSALSPALLIGTVLVVILIELLVLAGLLLAGRRVVLARAMLPGACAGLFLTLALRSLHSADGWLALWLTLAGAAHAADWWQRAGRRGPR